jgi:hypothetical protein
MDWTVRGSNPGGVEIFLTHPDRPWGPPSLLSRPTLGPTQPPIQTDPGAHPASYTDRPCGPPSLLYNRSRFFPEVKRPGRGVGHPPSSSAEVEGRVELYIYPPPPPPAFVACSWVNFTIPSPEMEIEHSETTVPSVSVH